MTGIVHLDVEVRTRLVTPAPHRRDWYHDLICPELEGVTNAYHRGKGLRLVICIPPGSMKSLLVSVYCPPGGGSTIERCMQSLKHFAGERRHGKLSWMGQR